MTGLVVAFADEAGLLRAVDRLRAEGVTDFETVTPHAVEALGGPPSPLPLIILIAALTGLFGGLGMEAYASAVSYPINIGGRPLLSWPAFVPIAFEIGVLFAIAGGFFGFLIVNRLPALSVGRLDIPISHATSRDDYLLILRTDELRPAMAELRPVRIEDWRE
jgi:hypothetical protein